jgi:hypothetical protein
MKIGLGLQDLDQGGLLQAMDVRKGVDPLVVDERPQEDLGPRRPRRRDLRPDGRQIRDARPAAGGGQKFQHPPFRSPEGRRTRREGLAHRLDPGDLFQPDGAREGLRGGFFPPVVVDQLREESRMAARRLVETLGQGLRRLITEPRGQKRLGSLEVQMTEPDLQDGDPGLFQKGRDEGRALRGHPVVVVRDDEKKSALGETAVDEGPKLLQAGAGLGLQVFPKDDVRETRQVALDLELLQEARFPRPRAAVEINDHGPLREFL